MGRGNGVLARSLAFLVLLCVAVALMVWFGHLQATPDPASWHLLGGEALAEDYGAAVGERIEIYGHVVATNPIVIEGTYGGTDLRLTVIGVENDVSVGHYLHVYGVAEPGYTIRALGTVVYPEKGILVTYLLSAIGGAWTVGRFLNRWRFDREGVAFVSRERPMISLPRMLDDYRSGGG